MWNWTKKLLKEEPKPEQHTTMVEVLKELWDIDVKKPHEMPPPDVNHDIYHVESRDKTVPRRDPSRKHRYKRAR